jgi:lipopolysaccharide transport system permease protein
LGVAWVVLQPIVGALIFSFVFGRIAKLPSNGIPYFIFSYAGLTLWTAFSSTLTKSGSALVQGANMVSKVYFPRLILPLSTAFSTLIDFTVSLALLAVMMLVNHVHFTLALLLLPLWLVASQLLALGFGLWTGGMMVRYRDIVYVLPVVVQFLMYASPVAYSASNVPHHYKFIYYLNPLAGLLDAFRWSVFGTGWLGVPTTAYAVIASLVVFIAGAIAFRNMERGLADVI